MQKRLNLHLCVAPCTLLPPYPQVPCVRVCGQDISHSFGLDLAHTGLEACGTVAGRE